MKTVSSPWMKFYPQDWRADEKLRLCSLAARGLWIEMLAIMHRSERYGQLLIGGIVPTDAQLAVQVGALPDEVSDMVRQLETAGVFSRTGSGAIYSRRMTRDFKKAQIARKNGKNGGNPSLCKTTGNSASDNPQVKPPDNGGDKAQKPEARGSVSNETVGKPTDPVKVMFDLGVAVLTDAGSKPEAARSMLGKWRKQYGDGAVMAALTDCRSRNVSNPVEWITKRMQAAGPTAGNHALYRQASKYGGGSVPPSTGRIN